MPCADFPKLAGPYPGFIRRTFRLAEVEYAKKVIVWLAWLLYVGAVSFQDPPAAMQGGIVDAQELAEAISSLAGVQSNKEPPKEKPSIDLSARLESVDLTELSHDSWYVCMWLPCCSFGFDVCQALLEANPVAGGGEKEAARRHHVCRPEEASVAVVAVHGAARRCVALVCSFPASSSRHVVCRRQRRRGGPSYR